MTFEVLGFGFLYVFPLEKFDLFFAFVPHERILG
jgi:hypothetical protein